MNGNEINNIIKNLSELELDYLFNQKSKDTRFKYVGKGMQGIVYKLENYAIKIIKNDKKVLKEFKIIKLLANHNLTNFVKFYLVHETDKYVIYVMQFIKYTLGDWWYESDYTLCEFLEMMMQLLITIYIMNHELKFYHNDLKFNNIMVDELKKPIELIYIIKNKKYIIKSKYVFYIIDFGESGFTPNNGRLINDSEFISTIYKKIIINHLGNNYLKFILQTDKFKEIYNSYVKKYKNDHIIKKLSLSYAIDNNLLDTQVEKEIDKIPFEILHLIGSYDKDKNNPIKNIDLTFEIYKKYKC